VSVRIRLQRKGAKHMAFYRIVVADSRSPRDGRFVEQLGYYDPLRDPPEINIETPKVIDWLSKGAQPSGTVESLLRRVGIMQMWHEVRKGRSLDELGHIEDEARKRIDAKASMDKRLKTEAKVDKVTKKEQDAKPEAPAAESEAAGEAQSAPPVAEPETTEASAGPDEGEGTDGGDATSGSDGGASQDEAAQEAPAGAEEEPAASEEQKPE